MWPRSVARQERRPERERQSNGMPIKPNPLFRELLPKNARVYVLAVHLGHERAISRNERTLLRLLSRATKRLPSCAPVFTRTRTFFDSFWQEPSRKTVRHCEQKRQPGLSASCPLTCNSPSNPPPVLSQAEPQKVTALAALFRAQLPKRYGAGGGDVEAVHAVSHGNLHCVVARGDGRGEQARPLCAEHHGQALALGKPRVA